MSNDFNLDDFNIDDFDKELEEEKNLKNIELNKNVIEINISKILKNFNYINKNFLSGLLTILLFFLEFFLFKFLYNIILIGFLSNNYNTSISSFKRIIMKKLLNKASIAGKSIIYIEYLTIIILFFFILILIKKFLEKKHFKKVLSYYDISLIIGLLIISFNNYIFRFYISILKYIYNLYINNGFNNTNISDILYSLESYNGLVINMTFVLSFYIISFLLFLITIYIIVTNFLKSNIIRFK